MKKWVIFFILFALFVSLSFGAYLFLNRAEFASSRLSELLGTRVSIKNVSWSPKGFSFQNVTIYNTPDSAIKAAFSAKVIQVRMDPIEQCAYLFGYRPVVISKVSIDKPIFGIEFLNATGSESNWKILLNNALKNSETTTKSHRYHLKSLILEHVAIQLKATGKLRHPKVIKKIELGQLKNAAPISFDLLFYGSAKMTLLQIAEAQNLTEFRESINALTPLSSPHYIELANRKTSTNKPDAADKNNPPKVHTQTVAALNSL